MSAPLDPAEVYELARREGVNLPPAEPTTRVERHFAAFLREAGAALGLDPLDAEIILRADSSRVAWCDECDSDQRAFLLSEPCGACDGEGDAWFDHWPPPQSAHGARQCPPGQTYRCSECDGEGRVVVAARCWRGHAVVAE